VSAILTLVRAIHFAAALQLAGLFAFRLLVADPALEGVAADLARDAERPSRRMRAIAWTALATSWISASAWLLLQASAMSARTPAAVITSGIARKVIEQTQVGHTWLLRTGIAMALAGLLAQIRDPPGSSRKALIGACAASAASVAALVFAGHAGGTPGIAGSVHRGADAAHLLAAAVWLGGLAPLARLLAMAARVGGDAGQEVARSATRRFSMLGIASIGVLVASGVVNGWLLVGSFGGLFGSSYGRLLLGKLALFAGMVGVAATNRLHWLPRLSAGSAAAADAIRALRRNCWVEAALGLLVLAIVGALGILPPAAHGGG
jgi:putative copper resistance protein D